MAKVTRHGWTKIPRGSTPEALFTSWVKEGYPSITDYLEGTPKGWCDPWRRYSVSVYKPRYYSGHFATLKDAIEFAEQFPRPQSAAELKEAINDEARQGYTEIIKQKLQTEGDLDLSSVDDETLRKLAGADDDADSEASLGKVLGLDDPDAVDDMDAEEKDQLAQVLGGIKVNESVSYVLGAYTHLGASNPEIAQALQEHCGLKESEANEVLQESKGRRELDLDSLLEASQKIKAETIHTAFEEPDFGIPNVTVASAECKGDSIEPAQTDLEKASPKLKESEDTVTSPALEAELEKAGQNFFKTKLELHVNPGSNTLYAYGDLGWRKINPETKGKDHYTVSVSIKGGKLGSYHVHALHAYDDADYYWAYSYNLKDWFFKLNGTTERFHVQCSTIDEVLKELDRRNNKIEPRIMYDSIEPGSQGPKIEESTLTDALDDAMGHLRAAEKHNDDYDTVAVEQDIRGAEGKVRKAQMIAG